MPSAIEAMNTGIQAWSPMSPQTLHHVRDQGAAGPQAEFTASPRRREPMGRDEVRDTNDVHEPDADEAEQAGEGPQRQDRVVRHEEEQLEVRREIDRRDELEVLAAEPLSRATGAG